MGIKLYGDPSSTCYQRVAFILLEKGLDFETIVVSIAKREQKSSEHLKLHPFGKVPALDDDGFVVFESRAICKYVAKKYASRGTKLIPEDGDLKGFALFEQVCGRCTGKRNCRVGLKVANVKTRLPLWNRVTLTPHVLPMLMRRSIRCVYYSTLSFDTSQLMNGFRYLGLEIDEAVLATSLTTLDAVFGVYDGILAKQKYLAGDHLTLADLFHVPYGAAAKKAGAKDVFERYPYVKTWFEELEAMDSWKELGGEMVTSS